MASDKPWEKRKGVGMCKRRSEKDWCGRKRETGGTCGEIVRWEKTGKYRDAEGGKRGESTTVLLREGTQMNFLAHLPAK